jgi:hypothetical protein
MDCEPLISDTGQWLCGRAEHDPALAGRAARYLAGEHRSNDACLKARRYLEHYWEIDPAFTPSGADYRRAAHLLEAAGQPALAEFFDQIAGTDAELQAAAQAWTARYAQRPGGPAEQVLAGQLSDGTITLAGDVVRGVDGACYQPGTSAADPARPGEPVIVVTTMTSRELVTGFATGQAAAGWLADRARAGRSRPLADPPVEHLPRLTLEEHVLAWLLRHPKWLPDIGPGLRARLWTADCRAEIDAALRTATSRDQRAGYFQVEAELGRRMLRAPGWAAEHVGWPFGHWAQAYLRRLDDTTVSEDTARRAFQALTLDPAPDTNPARAHLPAPQAHPVPARSAGQEPGPDQDQRRHQAAFALQLPAPLARPHSLGARVRFQPPQP